jgi:hypothetical protein
LLDECLDWRFARDIAGHEVKTERQMAWSGIRNGELLGRASTSFDVFVTVDHNIVFQQPISSFRLGIVVLRARNNSRAELRRLIPTLLDAIAAAKPGLLKVIGV